jgi:hypothetical protein
MSTTKSGLSAGSPRQQKSQKELSIAELTKTGSGELKRLNVNLSADLMRRFKVKVTMEGKTMGEVVNDLINEYMIK